MWFLLFQATLMVSSLLIKEDFLARAGFEGGLSPLTPACHQYFLLKTTS
jgi:hypothetical protein